MKTLVKYRLASFFAAGAVLACLIPVGFAQKSSSEMAAMPPQAGMPQINPALDAAHMRMTPLRPANAADRQRAAQILQELRAALDKYKDYRQALADGFRIFAPQLPEHEKHFTNWRYAIEAQVKFDTAHPTSLLYDRTPDGGWKLVGAMYTAPRRYTEDQLNERVPLSVAQWHRHVDFCFPPNSALRLMRRRDQAQPGQADPQLQQEWIRFLTIADEQTCRQNQGRWVPQIYGWMVHVYPYEKDPALVWGTHHSMMMAPEG